MGVGSAHSGTRTAARSTAALWLAIVAGCGGAPPAQGRPTTPTIAPSAPEAPPTALELTLQAAGEAWPGRWDPAVLSAAVASWRRALTLPGADDRAIQLRLAEAAHYQGSALVARGAPAEEARAAFEAGIAAATAAGASDLDAEPSEALYWWAENRAGAAAQTDYAESVLAQHQVLAIMHRCAEAGRNYGHAGAARYLGSHHARPLAFARRNLAKARRHFDRAIASDPKYLPTRVAFARDYAVAAQDRSLFEQQVRFVMAATPASDADSADLELARAQAEALLHAAPNLFE